MRRGSIGEGRQQYFLPPIPASRLLTWPHKLKQPEIDVCLQCCHLNSCCVVFRAQVWVSALYFVSALLNARCSSSFCKIFHVSFNLLDTWWMGVSVVCGSSNSESAEFRFHNCCIRGRWRPQTTTTNEHKWLILFNPKFMICRPTYHAFEFMI